MPQPVRLDALRCDDCGSDKVAMVGIIDDAPLICRCFACMALLLEGLWKPGSAKRAVH